MLQRRAPKLDRLHLNVLIDVTRTHRRQSATTRDRGRRTAGRRRRSRSRKWTGVWHHQWGVENRDCSVVGYILDNIECHVAKVPVVSDAVSATKNGFACAEDVVSE